MRFLHTSDWHLGKKINDRYCLLKEQEAVLSEIVSISRISKPDFVIVAGDVFDKSNPQSDAQRLFYDTLCKLNDRAQVPILVIAGNHDDPRILEVYKNLAFRQGIIMLGWPDSVAELATSDANAPFGITQPSPGIVEIVFKRYNYPLRIICLPYPDESRLKVSFRHETLSLKDVLKARWDALASKYCDARGVNILVSHHFFLNNPSECIPSEEGERPIRRVGGLSHIDTSIIPRSIQYVALGHIHSSSIIDRHPAPCPVVYSGSPLAYSFNERSLTKYVKLVDLAPAESAQISKIELKCGKRLLKYSAENVEDAMQWLEKNLDALVILTVRVEEALPRYAIRAIKGLHPNIINIIPDPASLSRDADTPTRPMISDSRPLMDVFLDYFKSRYPHEEISEDLKDAFKEIVAHREATKSP